MTSHEQYKSSPKEYYELSEDDLDCLLQLHQRWLNSEGRFGRLLDREGLIFEGHQLDGIDLSHARIPDAYFAFCSIRKGRFIGTYMPLSTFKSCDVEEANFTEADLSQSTFSVDTNQERACFERANTRGMTRSLEEAENDSEDNSPLITETPSIAP